MNSITPEALEPKPLTPPTLAFAALARRLLQEKRNIMEAQDCRAENALEEARFGLVWHFRLDAVAKGSILGIGAGGLLMLGAVGLTSVFAGLAATGLGLAAAGLGLKMTRDAINNASMVDRAYKLYNEMSPAQFTQYINSAKPAGP